MTNPLFDNKSSDQKTGEEVDLASLTDEAAFKLMVGEAGRYKTPEALARAALFKDQHIKTLEEEKAQYKAALNDQVSIQALLEKLNAPTIVTPTPAEKKVDEKPIDQLDIQKHIESLIQAEMAKRSGQSAKERNINSVVETLRSNWGANFQTILESKAVQLGASKEQLLELASSHPAVFLNAVGATKKDNGSDLVPTTSTVVLKTPSGQLKNAKYYSDLRKSNPKQFNSTAVQRERLAMAKELGDKFFQ